MEAGQNKNGGASSSSAHPNATTSTTPSASTAPSSPARKASAAKGRTTGTTQDTVGVNTSRDTSGAFASRSYAAGAEADEHGQSVTAAGVRVRDDARQLFESISTFTTQAQDVITKTLDERPYVALGTAFGIGYLLGGGLRSKLTGLALTVGGRYFLNTMGNQLLGQVRR